MDDMWCSLQATDLIGLHHALPDAFWPPAFTDPGAPSFLADDNACFFGGGGDVDLMNSATTVGMEMDTRVLFGEDHLVMHQEEPILSSSSLSSKRTLSMDSGNSSSSFTLDPSDVGATLTASSLVLHRTPTPTPAPLLHGDEAAVTRAMMAVISSASSSTPVAMSAMQPQAKGPYFRRRTSTIGGASCDLVVGNGHGQLMPSNSNNVVAMPKNTASPDGESGGEAGELSRTTSSSNQVYHMISERKRREKLNDSFQALKSLLPPSSKKDKTTVLIDAANYLKTLEAQILELEQKNMKLERCIPCEEGRKGSTGRAHQAARVQITKGRPPCDSSDASQSQQISLRVAVMVECDIVDLVLRILECIRWMEAISVLSVDANTFSPQMQLQAIATIQLQIMDGHWDEASFQKAMTKAVDDATALPK